MSLDPGLIRIFTVDDHALLREGIAALIDAEPDMKLVAEASNGEEAIEKFRLLRPDITLMDLQMPGMNGIEAITRIQAEFSGARIIVLTTYTGDVQVLRALKAGARGYILKGKVHRELLGAIRAVHSGQKQIPPEIAAELAEQDLTGITASGPPLPVLLRSLEVLRDMRLAAERSDISTRHVDLLRLRGVVRPA